MDIRPFTLVEALAVYDTHAQQDFPPLELKPRERIQKMLEDGIYQGYGLYEESALKAYAFILAPKGSPYALLDYFAVVSNIRGKGYGSHFLTHLSEKATGLDGLMIEVEDPAAAGDEDDRSIRNRRIAFYERLGAMRTSVRACVYTVDFLILYLPLRAPHDDALLAKMLDKAYHTMLEEFVYTGHTTVTVDPA